ncbi:MAG: CRISPR-associated endoribonuclease Cas6, partial [Acaryochloris sp. SU_5_25]|nr:CRISPR-associated endoribonuclease Cas6 [Acaryochloris sp. SU_5_25]
MAQPRTPHKRKQKPILTWPDQTELLGLTLVLRPVEEIAIPPQYTTDLHSWFLDQVRRQDFELSSYLHDGQSEKPFTISALQGSIQSQGRSRLLNPNQTYQWTITALSQPVVAWLRQWLQAPPTEVTFRHGGVLRILDWEISHTPTTYAQLLATPIPDPPTVTLTFTSVTSFRHRGNHLPLPIPENMFHSYLRRWNHFSEQVYEQEAFLAWVDRSVVVLRHQLQSSKVMAGKRGSVTGFTGAVQFGIAAAARSDLEWVQLFMALGHLAPYAGTGHKTTFGLGQTQPGWSESAPTSATVEDILAQRIAELTALFMAQRRRTGGDRAS